MGPTRESVGRRSGSESHPQMLKMRREAGTEAMTKVVYVYGSSAGPNGRKYLALSGQQDFEVLGPGLPFPSWKPRSLAELLRWVGEAVPSYPEACRIIQQAADEFQPDVIVGSSMGGVVALGVKSPASRVLIAPATTVSFKGISSPTNPLANTRLLARTIILHAEADEVVPFAASLELLEVAAKRADPGEAATMAVIQERLIEAGYTPRHGRLIPIGRDHRCNDPDPADTSNRDPHPHRAMITSVRILAGLEPRVSGP